MKGHSLRFRIVSILTIIGCICCPFLFGGCAAEETSSAMENSAEDGSFEEGDPYYDPYYVDKENLEQAFTKIYQGANELLLETVHEPDEQEVEEVLGLDLSQLDDRHIRCSNGTFGVADIFVIKPLEEHFSSVLDRLEEIRQERIQQFERYDVYNSLKICTDAEVEQRGKYLILVMIENEEEALELIKPLIPLGEGIG